MSKKYSFLFLLILFITCALLGSRVILADTPTPTPTPTPDQSADAAKQQLENQIKDLENKINDAQGKEKTLSTQISTMDNQVKLTEARIAVTQRQIESLKTDIETTSKKITNLESTLNTLSKVLLNRIVATYEAGADKTFAVLAASGDFSDFFARVNYLRLAQAHDKKLVFETQQAKEDYANQKAIFEDKKQKIEALKKQLEGYTVQLNADKASKQALLTETQGSEANYQRLLAAAKAQLAGFSRFTASQGGASLLGGQTQCDDWGCYYNQRDSQWGGNALNGTGYTVASDGCLLTSMAMVYTHYGHRGVTPQTINSNSSNFASYYPAYLKYSISADGAGSSRVGISKSEMDSELSAGRPVIVGISYDGGPVADHFVVIVSGSNGSYIMNDPFTPNGHKIPFTDHYSVGSMREIDKVVGL